MRSRPFEAQDRATGDLEYFTEALSPGKKGILQAARFLQLGHVKTCRLLEGYIAAVESI